MLIKTLKYLVFSLIVIFTCMCIPTISHASTVRGLSLDDARMFNSVSTIKSYIDTLSAHHLDYLKLHVSDDQAVSIYNPVLKQTVATSYTQGGQTYSQKTKLPFLTEDDFKSILNYAQNKDVRIVLELDTPSHTKALIKLLKSSKYPDISKLISNGELDYAKSKTIKLVEQLWIPYLKVLPKGSVVSIGGDEFSNGSASDRKSYVKFVNQLNRFFNQNGITMQMYNDGLFKKYLSQYDKNIIIDYWSQSGDTTIAADKDYNLKYRASFNQAINSGFKVINADSSKLYAIFNTTSDSNLDDLANQFQAFSYDQSNKAYGSELSIWSESTKVNASQVVSDMTSAIANFSSTINI